jgi:hypothetical protein
MAGRVRELIQKHEEHISQEEHRCNPYEYWRKKHGHAWFQRGGSHMHIMMTPIPQGDSSYGLHYSYYDDATGSWIGDAEFISAYEVDSYRIHCDDTIYHLEKKTREPFRRQFFPKEILISDESLLPKEYQGRLAALRREKEKFWQELTSDPTHIADMVALFDD